MRKEILEKEIMICDIHAKRIQESIEQINSALPITPEMLRSIEITELSFIELLLNRFSKLQDNIGAKIFPALLELLVPNPKNNSFIDNLNTLEKLGILDNARYWLELRDMHNLLAHEYPGQENFMADKINEAIKMAKWLCEYWENIKPIIHEKISLL